LIVLIKYCYSDVAEPGGGGATFNAAATIRPFSDLFPRRATMRAWIQDVLGQMKSKQQLQGVLHDLCQPYGRADISCDLRESQQVRCEIRMADRPAAASVANCLGTSVQDSDMIVLEYQAPKEFKS
jgi:hypothetical protein